MNSNIDENRLLELEQKKQFKDIPGWEGLYAIAKDGTIWSYPKKNHKGRILKQHKMKSGYFYVLFTKNCKSKHLLVHRLIAMAYIPNPKKLLCVNHKDFDKQNNAISNLEWCSKGENTRFSHAQKTSTSKYKGVSWNKKRNKWVAQIKSQYIGQATTEIMAARMYDKAAKALYGKFAFLNNV